MSRAYVLINCELGSELSLIAELQNIEHIKEVHGTLGMYDLIVTLESDSKESINSILERIRKIPKISSTVTLGHSEARNILHTGKLTESDKNGSQAYIVICCDQSKEYEILQKLDNISEIREASVVFGSYDVICKIVASDYNTLKRVITKEIRNIKHVRTTMTLDVIIQ